jgi:hypothetical protein
VPRYIDEAKENGERFKYQCRYTKTITQLSNRKILIKHGLNVMHTISNLSTANKSRNISFINGAKKLEARFVFADHSFLASG